MSTNIANMPDTGNQTDNAISEEVPTKHKTTNTGKIRI